jgi:pre-mRNA-splicing helicase BRR2
MAEKRARQSQYEYKATASLVLQADRSMITKISRDEATGEVLSLRDKLKGEKMGSRFQRAEPPKELKKRLNKRKEPEGKKGMVLSSSSAKNYVGLFYRPSTRETKQTYELLLSFIQGFLGDVPRDVLYNAADEVLAYLKDESLRDKDKKKEIEALLNVLDDDKFYQLTTLGKKITDYTADKEEEDTAIDENIGVSIVFEDEEEVKSEKSSDEEEGEDTMATDALAGGGVAAEDVAAGSKDSLDPRLLDAYWLQRQLSKFYDALASQKKSLEVLEILDSSGNDREIENKLVLSLGYDNFDFIRTLRRNRYLILYCTKLAKAGTAAEKEEIEAKMRSIPELSEALSIFKGGDDGAAQKAAAARKEASRKARMDEELDVMDVDIDGAHGKTLLELDNLVFPNGGHFLASKRCDLPEGTRKEDKKGYQEIHIPAAKPPLEESESAVLVESMPDFAQPAFSKYRRLNLIQSRLYEPCLFSDENLLVCAPTGAGKTNVAMLCILRELGKHQLANQKFDVEAFKIVYISPMKSLVAEQTGSFSARLKDYGITVAELTGDQQLTKEQIDSTQVIVCTPEKWDIVTRKGNERRFTALVRLIIIDEIHLLHDERGPVLESIVSRTLRITETSQIPTRLVGLSATLPNYEDVADFLKVDHKKGLYFFDNSYRPVPLQQHFIGITEKKAHL